MSITPEQQMLEELTDQLKWNTEILDIAGGMSPELLQKIGPVLTQNQELIEKANQKIGEIKQST